MGSDPGPKGCWGLRVSRKQEAFLMGMYKGKCRGVWAGNKYLFGYALSGTLGEG